MPGGIVRSLRNFGRNHSVLLISAFAAYVPAILSSPGQVGADTKTYLYLDPGKVLNEASSLWNSDVALGTVTHQTIGYLWPMGPFYWLFEAAGSPDWFAQRIWIGSLLLLAGLGVRFLLRTMDWAGPGLLLAVLAYQLSPYLLDYSARISAVLLPWVGLPWMIGLTIRAARTQGWRHPALFALLTLTIGGVNATSLLLVGLAPVLWLVHAVFAERSLAWRDALFAALRIALLTVATAVWWIAGLVLQGGYSLPVTRYTETYEVVADAATAPEILRGLGYWFFYGNDKFGAWIQPSIEYTQGVWLLFLSFGLVVLALLSSAFVRWRHRSFFLLLLVTGSLIGIGSHPFDNPSLLGSLFKDFTRTEAGLSLRSTPRAVPMVVLATAVLLGAMAAAAQQRWPDWGRRFTGLVLAAVVLANPAIWRVRMVEEHLRRDEDLPQYWIDAAAWFDATDDGSRIWEVPGSDFASYRWGNTVDPITPGLMQRGFVSRELVPFGSPESANLLTAFDRKMQEGSLSADSVVPIAELMSVGEVVHRADLTFERFRTPRPVPTADFLNRIDGFSQIKSFGAAVPNIAGPEQTLRDEIYLATDPLLVDPSPVTAYHVANPLDVVRLRPTQNSQVVVGDGEGVIDAAAAGLIDTGRPIFFGADLVSTPDLAKTVLATPGDIIVTDTNRRRARSWGTLRENVGYTELAGEEPLRFDPQDNRLDVFPDASTTPGLDVDDTRTVAVQNGSATVVASRYGNPVTHTLDDRPVNAVDGRIDTAWTVADFAEARGEFLRIEFADPTTVSNVWAVQPQAVANRHITKLEVWVDGQFARTLELDPESWLPAGQSIEFDPVEGRRFDLVIADLDFPRQDTYPVGISPVGFAEIRLGDMTATTEWIRLPTAFLSSLGPTADDHGLSYVLTRERSNPQEPVRDEPEAGMRRLINNPTARTFEMLGTARLSAHASGATLDNALGRSAAGLTFSSTGWLEGDLTALPSAALDDNLSTAFTGDFGPQIGQAWRVTTDRPTDIHTMTLAFVNDADHSVPTSIRVDVDDALVGNFDTGLSLAERPRGSVATVTVPIDVKQATTVRIEITESADRMTQDWYSNTAIQMPFALAEVSMADMVAGPDQAIDTGCRRDLVSINGEGVPVRIHGSAADAIDRRPLVLEGCGKIDVGPGEVEIETSFVVKSARSAFDIDQLVLRSSDHDQVARETAEPSPLDPHWRSDTNLTVKVEPNAQPRWLVLGQSHNRGWRASLDGTDLGEPVLIDAFANGWLLPAGSSGTVELRWTPQRLVRTGLLISGLSILVCLGLVRRGRRFQPAMATHQLPWSQPTLEVLGTASARRVAGVAAVSVAAGGFAALNLPSQHWLAIPIAVVAAIAARSSSLRRLPSLAAGLTFGVVALLIMFEQASVRHPPDFIWPQQFDNLHVWGVAVVLLIAADYLASARD